MGKFLCDTGQESRWNKEPKFLRQTTDPWPKMPPLTTLDQDGELRKPIFCGPSISSSPIPDPQNYDTLPELLKAYIQQVNRVAMYIPTAVYRWQKMTTKRQNLQSFIKARAAHFQRNFHLRAGKPLPRNSHLLCLAPEFHEDTKLIWVGERLCQNSQLEEDAIHPIVLEHQTDNQGLWWSVASPKAR